MESLIFLKKFFKNIRISTIYKYTNKQFIANMENLFDTYTSAEKKLLLDEQEIVVNEFAEDEEFEDTVARYYEEQETAYRLEEMAKAYQEWQEEAMIDDMKNDPYYGYGYI